MNIKDNYIEIEMRSDVEHRAYEKLLGSPIDGRTFRVTPEFMRKHIHEISAIQTGCALAKWVLYNK
jgi:hypothetical protein